MKAFAGIMLCLMPQLVIAATSCSSVVDEKKRLECYDLSNKKGKTKNNAINDEAKAHKFILTRLKDPESARFGQFTLIKNYGACLTVNAKNSMGGYAGDKQAFLLKESHEFVAGDFMDEKISHEMCVALLEKAKAKENAGQSATDNLQN